MLKKWTTAMRGTLAVVIAGLATTAAQAQPFTFTQGNVIVQRMNGDANYGAGAAALAGTATPIFLDQFLPSTAAQALPVNTAGGNLSIALPTTVGGLAITGSGTATSEGFFSRTTDGLGLIVGGYNAALGATVTTSAPGTVNRSFGLINGSTLNSSNGFSDGPSSNIRSVVAASGTGDMYVSSNGNILLKSNTGSVTTTTAITAGNNRALGIFNNSLFVSSSAGTPGIGISLVGSVGSLPTGSVTTTLLPGTGTSGTGTPSPYAFFMATNSNNVNNWNGTGFNTMYVADDRSSGSGGGIQRWTYDGTTWSTSIGATITLGTVGMRGLTASVDAATNTTTIWATTASGSANSLVMVTDDMASNTFGTMITLATAPVNTVFRGVSLAPVPEPATVLGIAAGAFGVGGLIRRKLRKTA
ncbi:MAG: PEP-CTERM sorting domain-containing protein [Gemmataceae bacterium]|nr:PEP-CTERM sorting domain-containing protein [Gemmataceae bacterium]